MEPPFRVVRVAVRDDACRVSVSGDVDVGAAEEMRAALTEVISDPRTRVVFVDLEHVTYMGARGVGALVVARMLAEEQGTSVQIERWSPAVFRVLALCGVCDELGIPAAV